jgi:protein-L-isoaspartate O-methyltransferase
MISPVADFYAGNRVLADAIAGSLRNAGKDLNALTTADLAPVDEFHIRGRKATLELADRMKLTQNSRVLDIGSGLGGSARAIAEVSGCHVTGVDLTPAFCKAAEALSCRIG